VPVLVGDAALAKAASDKLLSEHDIYVQSINYPTVAVGEERLRITVTPRHTLEQMDKLVHAINKTFEELGINRSTDWKAAGGRAGVGMPGSKPDPVPIWTDEQIGVLDGSAPGTLRSGEQAVVDQRAVVIARARFERLLGPVPRAAGAVPTLKLATGGVGVGRAQEMDVVVPAARAVAAAA
jgi:5-aminolevulinate synthase